MTVFYFYRPHSFRRSYNFVPYSIIPSHVCCLVVFKWICPRSWVASMCKTVKKGSANSFLPSSFTLIKQFLNDFTSGLVLPNLALSGVSFQPLQMYQDPFAHLLLHGSYLSLIGVQV